ncbi:MAG: 3-hydroxyacyl-CoA dehydrogenase, partial [Pseudomonadota bacterium]
KGFYEYDGQNKITHIWPKVYDRFPVKNTSPDVNELKRRFLHIQAIETLRCMEEGVVTAADDADVGSIFGWGFAPWTGGVLSYADDIGLDRFLKECEELEKKYGRRFQPPQLLKDMVAKGRSFYHQDPSAMAAE